MNFQGLTKIEDADFYLELAFRRAKDRAKSARGGLHGTRLEKSRKIELMKCETATQTLNTRLLEILKAYPSFDQLPDFYQELVKCTLDYVMLKKSLGAVNWAVNKTQLFFDKYEQKMKACRELDNINKFRREFYGRISSVVKQIKTEIEYLEHARKVMKGYPAIKTSMPTIAIAGFPNVGKTTLLFKLTGSKPDIQPYAFTTKGINVGYLEKDKEKIQLLDTPGTLDRFEKMNDIEKVADLALRLLAEKIIYVFDFTEPFPLNDQITLYEKVKQLKKEVIVYCSKSDVVKTKEFHAFVKKYNGITDPKKLKALI